MAIPQQAPPASAMASGGRSGVTQDQVVAEFTRQAGRAPTQFELQAIQSMMGDISSDVRRGETLERRVGRGMPSWSKRALEAQGVAQAGQTARVQDMLLPLVLADQGYEIVRDETGQIVDIVEKEDPEAEALQQQESEILRLSNQRTLDAMQGNLKIDPSVEADLGESEAQLRAELLRKLGPGAEGSDSWNRAMAEFEKQANSMRYSIRHGQMTTADAMATNRQNTRMRRSDQQYGQMQGITSPLAMSSSMIAQTLNPWYQQREGERNRRTAEDAANSQMIGSAVGSGIGAAGAIGAALSDATLKENVVPIDDVLDKLDSIRGVQYDFIDGEKDQIGVIAQEVKEVFPELVIEGHDSFLRVNYAGLAAVAIQAVKELKARLEAVEEKLK